MTKNTHKLYIPFSDYQYIGGPATFMRNLEIYLRQAGFSCLGNPQQAKVIFFPTATYPRLLRRVKSEGGYLLQRLDGVYYPSQHGEEYARMNQPVEQIYREYADFVIFQSDYSRRQCFQMFGEKSEENYCIIYNGVHKHLFFPTDSSPRSLPETIRFVTTGSYRKAAMLEPIVTALDNLKERFNFELWVVGPLHNQELAHFFERDYLHHVGPKHTAEVGEILRNSHIFIHSQLNDNCPNAVIEAISCGLPVVGFNSGAMSELCFFSQELLADVADELFHRYEDFDPSKLAEKITLVIQHYEHYQELARSHSYLYAFEECGQQYLTIFQRYLMKRRKMVPYMTTRITRGLTKVRRIPSKLKNIKLGD